MTSTNEYIPKKGDYVQIGVFTGIVLDVFWNKERSDGLIKLMLVKNIFQRNKEELQYWSTLKGRIELCEHQKIKLEVAKRLVELDAAGKEFFDVEIIKAVQN